MFFVRGAAVLYEFHEAITCFSFPKLNNLLNQLELAGTSVDWLVTNLIFGKHSNKTGVKLFIGHFYTG